MGWSDSETYVLGEVADRLDARLDELADTVSDEQPDDDSDATEAYQEAVQEARDVDQHYKGVLWAVEQWGADAEVVLAPLATGAHAQVLDYSMDLKQNQVGGPDSIQGSRRLFFVAAGLEDAPFLDGGEDIEARVGELSGLPNQFTGWLHSEVDDISSPDVEGNGFAERLQARNDPTNSSDS